MSMRGIAWSDAMDSDLMSLVDQGKTLRQIADAFRFPTWFVHCRVRDLGLELGPSLAATERQSARVHQMTERWLDQIDMIEPAFNEAITRITTPTTYRQLGRGGSAGGVTEPDTWHEYEQDTPSARDIRDLAQAAAALAKTVTDMQDKLSGRVGQNSAESLLDRIADRLRGKTADQ